MARRFGFGLAFFTAYDSDVTVLLEDSVVATGVVPVAGLGSVGNHEHGSSPSSLHGGASDILVSIDDSFKVDAPILYPLLKHWEDLGWMCRINDESIPGFVVGYPRVTSAPPRCLSGLGSSHR